jgi:large subunit ribosomal protein L4
MKEINTTIPVYDLKGKVVENIQLDKKLFDGKVNMTVLWEARKMYEANNRKGNASAKTRAEVSGGGSKPWRQKGTGRARVGSSRNPLWYHGGVTFPPKPRDHGYSMPKKTLKAALISILNARLGENGIKVVVKMDLKEAKTKEAKDILNNLDMDSSVLVVVNAATDNIKLALRNIPKVALKEGKNINARDVLLKENLVIEKEALLNLVERLK